MLWILDRHDSMDSECDGAMKWYKEKYHADPDPINVISPISLIHSFPSIITASALHNLRGQLTMPKT
jgi:hypothetical protein